MQELNNRQQFAPKPSRPRMPQSYGIYDVAHQPPLWSQISEQMRASRNYWIGTVQPDGSPHVMPVWGIWLNDTFYFVTKRESRKAHNLFLNPKIVVHLESGDNAVIFHGLASEVKDSSLLRQIADMYAAKYDDDQIFPDIEVVFVLNPCVAFTWLEKDYCATATRWRFIDK